MIWQFIQSLIRHGLTSAGALVVTKGLASQSDTDTAVGAIMVLVGFGHSLYVKWKASQTKSSPVLSSPRQTPPGALLMLYLAGAFISLGIFAGCQTTPQQATYEAAGTTIVTVDTAMSEWGAYVAANHPPATQEAAVKSAYEKYQAAMAAVCDAGEVYAATVQSGGTNIYGTTSAAQIALNQAIANSSQELGDLERLIASFGVKIQ